VYNSISGQDNMLIKSPSGSNQKLSQMPFNVIDRDGFCEAQYSVLNLAHETAFLRNAFLDAIFKTEKESVAAVVFDR
jgi:hypothetical protein